MIALLQMLAASVVAASPVAPAPREGEIYAQIVVRSHVVIRVEAAPAPPARPLASLFRERKGPRCIAMNELAGAAVIEPDSVDFALRTGQRMRARFAASCPALNYYSGFYLAPTPDGKFCAARDAVRDRAGGECAVVRIKELSPRK